MTGNSKQFLVAIDAGGTMTDTFLVDEAGVFNLGKALTNPADESKSYLASVGDAAAERGMAARDIHARCSASIYTGTTMLNLLMTQSGSKIGLLTTKGQGDQARQERNFTWLGLSYEDTMHQVLHEHAPALVETRNVKEVAERIEGPTYFVFCYLPPETAVVPLREADVREGVAALLDNGVDAIAILFLHSYCNPAHEMRAAEIARDMVQARGVDVPVVTSYDISPTSMESQRLKTLLIHCYSALPAAKQLQKIEAAARSEGYDRHLLTFLSYGATVDVRYPRIVEGIISGPCGGLLGSKFLLGETKGLENILCMDLGGTTFDVGIIARGYLPINSEPTFAGHKLNLPMVDIDSIGAGTGTVIHVDGYLRRITLGPESMGSRVGTCYGAPEITIGDIDLILGYLNPDNFLGGTVKLDTEAALRALEARLARPLGKDVYDISSDVLDMLHDELRTHVNAMMTTKGYASTDFTLLCYGGSGPLHMWGVADHLDVAGICTVPWAAAFSAFGVAASDYFHRYQKSILCVLSPQLPADYQVLQAQALNHAWRELEQKALAELGQEGFSKDEVRFEYGIYARYLGQMVSWEAPVPISKVVTPEDLNKVIQSFETAYSTIYPAAARFPQAGYAITEAVLKAVAEKVKPTIPTYELKKSEPSGNAYKGHREVYHKRKWTRFDIWEMDLLEAGNRIDGPAIVEHSMTTLVVAPDHCIDLDEHKVIWYRRKDR
ncbi:MAG: hydantoinase/oxoprolinase family protein [Ardenticatenaceae bacterium]|nr:hydantoinase/oxoprolinase family protein [Ardenticatenaceae bacterium]